MRDILEVIAEKESEVARLQEDIAALKKAAKILGVSNGDSIVSLFTSSPQTAATPNQNNGSDSASKSKFGPKWTKSIGDASEEIFREAGPLHVEELHRRLHAQGIEPTLASLDSALRKDGKGRFKLHGKRIYGLK